MKKIQILITIAFVLSIISFNVYAAETNIFAEQSDTVDQNTGIFKDHDKKDKSGNRDKDPLKRLEEKKESIQKDLKEGKITQEKADEMTQSIDKHIAKIKEFNSLSLPQKRDRLYTKFKSHVEKDVNEGKMTKEESEKLLQDFSKKLENWDGKDFPKFMKKHDEHKK